MTYQLSKRQVERIKKSLHKVERTPKGLRRPPSTYKPSGTILQGQLTSPVYYDSTKSPNQWSGQMTIWSEPDPSDKTSILAAVDSEVDQLTVWPALTWPDQTQLNAGEYVVVAWISGRWRIILPRDCPSAITDSDY